jgi:hypothetical protein
VRIDGDGGLHERRREVAIGRRRAPEPAILMIGETAFGAVRCFPDHRVGGLLERAPDQRFDERQHARIDAVAGENGMDVRGPLNQAENRAQVGISRHDVEKVPVPKGGGVLLARGLNLVERLPKLPDGMRVEDARNDGKAVVAIAIEVTAGAGHVFPGLIAR